MHLTLTVDRVLKDLIQKGDSKLTGTNLLWLDDLE